MSVLYLFVIIWKRFIYQFQFAYLGLESHSTKKTKEIILGRFSTALNLFYIRSTCQNEKDQAWHDVSLVRKDPRNLPQQDIPDIWSQPVSHL